MLHYQQITELIQKFRSAQITLEEEALLQQWVNAEPGHQALLDKLEDPTWLLQEMREYEKGPTKEAEERLWAGWEQEEEITRFHIHERKPVRWIRYAAAVAVVAIAGTIGYKVFFTSVRKASTAGVVQADSAKAPLPGTDKATLRLANGAVYTIADKGKSYIARVGDLEFTREGGVIYCKRLPGMAPSKQVGYHMLETPRGGRYQLVLPDGTKVWLNSTSRIQFRTADMDGKRMVQLEGEAYFEVAPDSSKPFIARTHSGDVTVTGTHFNLSAYGNENLAKVTLEEGKLSVNAGGQKVEVKPAQSALFAKDRKPQVEEANLDKILAWKEGLFVWKGDSVTTALEEIERWYNVTVQYKERPTATIYYVIQSRDWPLDSLMNLIKTSLTPGDTSLYYERKNDKLFVSKQRLH